MYNKTSGKAGENERVLIVDDGRELIGLDGARKGFCGTYLTLTKITQMRRFTSGMGLFLLSKRIKSSQSRNSLEATKNRNDVKKLLDCWIIQRDTCS